MSLATLTPVFVARFRCGGRPAKVILFKILMGELSMSSIMDEITNLTTVFDFGRDMEELLDEAEMISLHMDTINRFLKWKEEHPRHTYPKTHKAWIAFLQHTFSIAFWSLSESRLRRYLSCELEDLGPIIRKVIDQYNRGEFVVNDGHVAVRMIIDVNWVFDYLVKHNLIEISETAEVAGKKRSRQTRDADTEEDNPIWSEIRCNKQCCAFKH